MWSDKGVKATGNWPLLRKSQRKMGKPMDRQVTNESSAANSHRNRCSLPSTKKWKQILEIKLNLGLLDCQRLKWRYKCMWWNETLNIGERAGCGRLILVILTTWEAEIRRIMVQGQPGQRIHKDPISKIITAKWTGSVPHVVESLLCKCEALSSNSSPTN
jgi:hypothetical protein